MIRRGVVARALVFGFVLALVAFQAATRPPLHVQASTALPTGASAARALTMAVNPLGPIPQRCPAGTSSDCLGGLALAPGFLTESWLGGLEVSPHLVHVGQQVSGTIGAPAALTTPCYGAPHCASGFGWSGLAALGPEVTPCPGDYSNTSCTVTARQASASPVAGQSNWQILRVDICGVPGCATDNDYIYVTADGAISGSVLNSAGKPIAGASVVISGPGSDISAPVDANTGFYYAMNLVPGSYNVTAADANGVPIAVSACSGSVSNSTCTVAVDQQDGLANFTADGLLFPAHPEDATMTRKLTSAVQVAVVKSDGNVDISSTASVTLALGSNPAGGKLSGSLTRQAVAGIATFDDLAIDKPDEVLLTPAPVTGYTLIATGPDGATATSSDFHVRDAWNEMLHVSLSGWLGPAAFGACSSWNQDILSIFNGLRGTHPAVFANLDYGPIDSYDSIPPTTGLSKSGLPGQATLAHHAGIVVYITGTDWRQTGVVIHGTAAPTQYTQGPVRGTSPYNLLGTVGTWADNLWVYTAATLWETGNKKKAVLPTDYLVQDPHGNPLYFGTTYPAPVSTPVPGASCPLHPITVSTHSPVDMTLINGAGQVVQTQGGGLPLMQLPNYNPAYEFLNPTNGTVDWDLVVPQDSYTVVLTGTGSGPFTLTVSTPGANNSVVQQQVTGTVTPGAQRAYTVAPTGSITAGVATTVTSSGNPSQAGSAVVLTAAVIGCSPAPGGTVTFKDGTTTLGTGTLDGAGKATFGTSPLAPGVHSLTAVSGGSGSCTGGPSVPLLQNVLTADVSGNGIVDAVDALCVLRSVAGLLPTPACPDPLPHPDVNGDGVVDAVDALCVLRYVAGLSATTACPLKPGR
ncbi:MAG: Ig-like domain repeat protein [Dehalococcoidia bacterium]